MVDATQANAGIAKQFTSSLAEECSSDFPGRESASLLELGLREARSVSIWAAISSFLRILLSSLVRIDAFRKDGLTRNESESQFLMNILIVLSIVAGWILSIGPHKATLLMAPGFVYASPWLLFYIRDRFGSIPNIPLRICEAMIGRISVRELLLVVIPVHFLCTLSTMMVLEFLLSNGASSLAFDPVVYSNKNLWIIDFFREIFVTCAFTVAMLVLPELFALNNVPRWIICLFLYPLFNFSVDAKSMGSTFGPNVLSALTALRQGSAYLYTGQSGARFFGSLCGGVIGGQVMRKYFPDDPSDEV